MLLGLVVVQVDVEEEVIQELDEEEGVDLIRSSLHQLAVADDVDEGEVTGDPSHEPEVLAVGAVLAHRGTALRAGGKHIPQDLLKGMTLRPPNHLTDLLLLPRIRIILSRKVRVQLHLR